MVSKWSEHPPGLPLASCLLSHYRSRSAYDKGDALGCSSGKSIIHQIMTCLFRGSSDAQPFSDLLFHNVLREFFSAE
jgi:hypothetical protein